MIEIVSLIGFTTMVVLVLSSRYYDVREELHPKWWYAVSAICMVYHFILAFLIYEEHPIIAILLFIVISGFSYTTCKMAILQDRLVGYGSDKNTTTCTQ